MTLLIKQNKIDINAANNQGDTALHIAAKAGTGGNDQSIQSLLASGAKVNIQNQASQTALHYAAENNAVNATKVLLDKGADSTIRDRDGKQPVDLVARVKGNEEILEILSKATKSIEERGFAPTLIPEDVLTQALVKGLEASKQHEHSADKSSKDTAHEGSKPVAPTIHPTIPLELKKAAAAIGHEIAEASKKATATDASQSQQSRDGITH